MSLKFNLIKCIVFTEDGEVFQIKKSSQSKKLIRMLDKERRKKKEKSEKMEIDDVDIKLENSKQEVDNDDFVVSITQYGMVIRFKFSFVF